MTAIYFIKVGEETETEPKSGWYFKLCKQDKWLVYGPFSTMQRANETAKEKEHEQS